jgi:hypothetical protein
MTCAWCDAPFIPFSRGGRVKRFCAPRCRARFHSAARRYTEAQIKAGFLTPEMIRAWDAGRSHEIPSCTTQSASAGAERPPT